MTMSSEAVAIHPLGEGEFALLTPGGRVRLSVTKDNLTPFGGLRRGPSLRSISESSIGWPRIVRWREPVRTRRHSMSCSKL
jgi:hypothetical protein